MKKFNNIFAVIMLASMTISGAIYGMEKPSNKRKAEDTAQEQPEKKQRVDEQPSQGLSQIMTNPFCYLPQEIIE